MADLKRGREAKDERWEPAADDDPSVVAPRFDEREEATARPVVPLDRSNNAASSARTTTGTAAAAGGFSLRAISRHLVLAWAVVATMAVAAVMLYQSAHTAAPQIAPQPAPESVSGEAATATPQPARREVPIAPARAPKMIRTHDPLPSWEAPGWSDGEDTKRDERDEEKLDERARKEEKRRRKEEKKRREEAEEDMERALKEARKQAERQREKMKDEGAKSRLIGVLTKRSGM